MINAERGFLESIRENRDDDMPRLAYADWLDDRASERNEPVPTARSLLIRTGIELYRSIHRDSSAGVTRAGTLRPEKNRIGNWTDKEHELGRLEAETASLVYGTDFLISTMWGWGNRGKLADGDDYGTPDVLTISRGFLVRVKCRSECYHRLEGWAYEPIRKVTFSDAEPSYWYEPRTYYRFISYSACRGAHPMGSGFPHGNFIPHEIAVCGDTSFQVVSDQYRRNEGIPDGWRVYTFVRRQDAMAWLSRAIFAYMEKMRAR